MENETSEFGRGYAYCLGLFLAHEWELFGYEERAKSSTGEYADYPSLWLYGACDHLMELEIPAQLPDTDKHEIQAFSDKAHKYRLSEGCSFQDCRAMLDEAKNLLLKWDKFCGITSAEAQWK